MELTTTPAATVHPPPPQACPPPAPATPRGYQYPQVSSPFAHHAQPYPPVPPGYYYPLSPYFPPGPHGNGYPPAPAPAYAFPYAPQIQPAPLSGYAPFAPPAGSADQTVHYAPYTPAHQHETPAGPSTTSPHDAAAPSQRPPRTVLQSAVEHVPDRLKVVVFLSPSNLKFIN